MIIKFRKIRPSEITLDMLIYWADPEDNICSGLYRITEIDSGTILLTSGSGSETEALENEIYLPE